MHAMAAYLGIVHAVHAAARHRRRASMQRSMLAAMRRQVACCIVLHGAPVARRLLPDWPAHSLCTPMLFLSLQPGELMAGAWGMASDPLWLEARRLAAAPHLGQETRRALDTSALALASFLADGLSGPASQRAHMRQQQLQLMRSLAELLQQVWDLPEQQEAARLATAQVAATRSCAYLRCANVGGGGGPAAGEGDGSSRCSACRVAW